MTICAKFDGRQVRECTRGLQNCPCLFEKMQEVLANIGYPRRGDVWEDVDRFEMGKYVNENFTRKELGIE